MTILFVANGEAEDGLTGSFTISASNIRTNYARGKYSVPGGATNTIIAALDAPTDRFSLKTWWQQNSNNGITLQQWMMEFSDGSDARIRVHPDTTQGAFALRIETVDGATVNTVLLTNTFVPTPTSNSAMTPALINVDINYTETGFIRVYVEEILVGEFLGDPRVGGSTDLDSVVLRGARSAVASWSEASYSSILIADQSLHGIDVVTLSPNGAGFINEWTGAHTDINNTGAPNANYVASDTADEEYLFAYTDLNSIFGEVEVLDLIVRSLVQRGASGPQQFAQQIRSGSTNYEGDTHALTLGYTLVEDRWAINPDGTVPWDNTSLAALQVGGVSKT